MKHAWVLTLALWLGALALAGIALRQMPLGNILHAAGQLSLQQVLVWAALNLAVMLLSAERWRQLLLALDTGVSLTRLLTNRLAGQTISFLTPGPQFGGEPLQVLWLVRRDRVPLSRALLSLGLDRLLELWVNFSVLLLGLLIVLGMAGGVLPQDRHTMIVVLVLLGLLSGILLLLLRRPHGWLRPLRQWCQRWQHHPRLANMDAHWEALDNDMKQLSGQSSWLLPRCLMISLLIWSAILIELWWLTLCAGIDIHPAGFALLAVSIRLAMLLPLPGGIGSIETAVLWTAPLIGADLSQALALLLLMRSRDLVLLLCGLAALVAQWTRQGTD
ncbi:MAG: flippase-like domain-containing protein [Pseudomonadales bacterium]|nr:flippase-like domain-containing protein [Pseudomonadales bacterium]MCP5357001.1 flippase-like domain-containing protein [Pseudomonadales bacterium]